MDEQRTQAEMEELSARALNRLTELAEQLIAEEPRPTALGSPQEHPKTSPQRKTPDQQPRLTPTELKGSTGSTKTSHNTSHTDMAQWDYMTANRAAIVFLGTWLLVLTTWVVLL